MSLKLTSFCILEELPILDRWMLNRSFEVIDQITKAFEKYEFSKFFQIIQSFCVVDLSNFYLKLKGQIEDTIKDLKLII